MFKIINVEKNNVDKFLNFSKEIYGSDYCENQNEVKQIVLKKHIFSKYFSIDSYLLVNDEKVLSRFSLISYPNDKNLYFGFYESIDDSNVSNCVLDFIDRYAFEHKFQKIVGPLNGIFWVKYRFKINKFEDDLYFSEPYNKSYYLSQFLKKGYNISEVFYSNRINKNKFCVDRQYEDIINNKIINQYSFKTAKQLGKNKLINDLYDLFIDLYSDFTMYKYISRFDFIEYYNALSLVLDNELSTFVYRKSELIAFFISLKDIGNNLYNKKLKSKIELIKNILINKYVVMLHIGVKKSHRGIGKIIAYIMLKRLFCSKKEGIAALISENKVTRNFFNYIKEDDYEYVMLEKKI